MTWEELASILGATPTTAGCMDVTWQRPGQRPREYLLRHVIIRDWHLVLLQTTLARAMQFSAAEAVARLLPFPLGALVCEEGFWVLRQVLPLDGLNDAQLRLALACLDFQALQMSSRREVEMHVANTYFNHYAE